jgi:membrane protein DedA with SNARE-associated domain
VLVPLVPFAVIGELPGERWLQAAGHDALAFGGMGALLLALDVLLPIPSSVIGALLGARLGFAQGFAFAFAGLCTGHAVGYALGRLAPVRYASALPSAPSAGAVLLSRPVPVFAEAVAIAAGVTRMPPWLFLASAAFGNAVYAAVLAADGAALLPAGLAGPGLIVPLALPVAGYLLYRAFTARAPSE